MLIGLLLVGAAAEVIIGILLRITESEYRDLSIAPLRLPKIH